MSRSSSAIRERFTKPRQLLALGGRQPGLALGAIGPRVLHPLAQRRRGQIELARDRPDPLAFVEDEAHRLLL